MMKPVDRRHTADAKSIASNLVSSYDAQTPARFFFCMLCDDLDNEVTASPALLPRLPLVQATT